MAHHGRGGGFLGHLFHFHSTGVVPIFTPVPYQPMYPGPAEEPEAENASSFKTPGGFLQSDTLYGITILSDGELAVARADHGRILPYAKTDATSLGHWMRDNKVDVRDVSKVDLKLKLNGVLTRAYFDNAPAQPVVAPPVAAVPVAPPAAEVQATPLAPPPQPAPVVVPHPTTPPASQRPPVAALKTVGSEDTPPSVPPNTKLGPGNYSPFTSGSNSFAIYRQNDGSYEMTWYNSHHQHGQLHFDNLRHMGDYFSSNRGNVGDENIGRIDTDLGLNGSLRTAAGIPDAPAAAQPADQRGLGQKIVDANYEWNKRHAPTPVMNIGMNAGGGG